MRQSVRRLSDITTSKTTNENQHASTAVDTTSLSSIMSILEQMNENFNKINGNNEEMKQFIASRCSTETDNTSDISIVKQHLIALHAKIDQQSTLRSTVETKNTSLIIDKLNALQDNLFHPTNHNKKLVSENHKIKNTDALNICKGNYKGVTTTDPLEWSFSFNQSILPNDNADLHQMLHGFEQNTWTTFDYIRNKLDENTESVLNIESICREINLKNSQQILESPVTDSIKLDTLQIIQDKCEIIQDKCDAIERKILACDDITGKQHLDLNDQSIQQLRERLNKLVSMDEDLSCNMITLPNTNVHIDNSMNYPVIDELLEVRPTSNNSQIHMRKIPPRNDKFGLGSCKYDHEIYVSKLPTYTTCDDVKDYISRNSSIDIDKMRVHRLTKKHQDISELSFISFKIETNNMIAEQLLRNEFWPSHVFVKVWKSKKTQFPSLNVNQSSNHFLSTTNSERRKL